MLLFPILATNATVAPTHPVVVQAVRRNCSVIPGGTDVSSFTAPAHGATTAAALALLAWVEPFVQELAIPVPIHKHRMRGVHSLQAVQ